MKNSNAEKTVLVTGAGRGIGRAIAKAAAEAGYRVIIHYNQSKDEAEKLKASVLDSGGSAETLRCNIADREECRIRLEALAKNEKNLWGIVCNAGLASDALFSAMSDENWDSVMRTNLDGFYNVLRPLIMPFAKKRKGRIITIASVSGVIGNKGQVNYSASKAGVIGASKALALELALRQITVNCIAPGLIESDMTKTLPLEEMLPLIPMGRIGSCEEVAALAVFLLSESASYITRQVISVNGGLA